jgi:hypothetical protein
MNFKGAYGSQKRSALRRGIGWDFTYDTWLEWWGEDITKRGRGSNDLCMARTGDTGPYAPWNVRKAKMAENISEALTGKPRRDETKQKISEGKKGTKYPPQTEEHKRKLSEALKGRKRKQYE